MTKLSHRLYDVDLTSHFCHMKEKRRDGLKKHFCNGPEQVSFEFLTRTFEQIALLLCSFLYHIKNRLGCIINKNTNLQTLAILIEVLNRRNVETWFQYIFDPINEAAHLLLIGI